MNLNEASGALDSATLNAHMHMDFEESMKAPAIVYDVSCVGPDESDREDYLALLFEAEQMRLQGNVFRAEMLKKEAQALVKEQWSESVHNTVMIPGKTDILDKYLKGAAYTAAWYMILVGGVGTIANTDTLASHPGWTEQTPYAGNRPTITWGTTSAGSNTATTVVITANANFTVTGAGICSVNTGTSGVLYSAASFAAARSGGSGDTLNITPTLTIS